MFGGDPSVKGEGGCLRFVIQRRSCLKLTAVSQHTSKHLVMRTKQALRAREDGYIRCITTHSVSADVVLRSCIRKTTGQSFSKLGQRSVAYSKWTEPLCGQDFIRRRPSVKGSGAWRKRKAPPIVLNKAACAGPPYVPRGSPRLLFSSINKSRGDGQKTIISFGFLQNRQDRMQDPTGS